MEAGENGTGAKSWAREGQRQRQDDSDKEGAVER